MTDFQTQLDYLVREFERDVKAGEEAEAKTAENVTKYGIGYALEWAGSHVVDSMHGRVATTSVLPRLKKVETIEDLEQVHKDLAQLARNEVSYMSLGNSQLYLTGKMAMCQSLGRAVDRIGGFITYQRKEDQK